LREKKVIAGQKHLANIRIKKINGDGELVTCRIIGDWQAHGRTVQWLQANGGDRPKVMFIIRCLLVHQILSANRYFLKREDCINDSANPTHHNR
jgi:hypothetical protein